MAPEIMNSFNQDISKADIFSLGITLFELMTGEELPLNGNRWHELRKRTISVSELSSNYNYSESLKGFVSRMMAEKSEKRPTAKAMLTSECFQSDTILELKWQKILYAKQKAYLQELEKIKSPPRKSTI